MASLTSGWLACPALFCVSKENCSPVIAEAESWQTTKPILFTPLAGKVVGDLVLFSHHLKPTGHLSDLNSCQWAAELPTVSPLKLKIPKTDGSQREWQEPRHPEVTERCQAVSLSYFAHLQGAVNLCQPKEQNTVIKDCLNFIHGLRTIQESQSNTITIRACLHHGQMQIGTDQEWPCLHLPDSNFKEVDKMYLCDRPRMWELPTLHISTEIVK